eukprot:scaffold8139_cov363-Prasinococcus_capsulatus_cf.AAC.4
MRAGLALTDLLPKSLFQMCGIVVAEDLHGCPTPSCARHNGRVIESIAHDERAFAHEGRDREGIGREAHAVRDRRRLTHELCNQLLQLLVEIGRTSFGPATRHGGLVLSHGLDDPLRAVLVSGTEPKIVV